MKINLSKQFMDLIKRFLELDSEGQLINITEVYEAYGKPKYISPRQRLRSRILRMLLGNLIVANKFEIEKVVRYKGKDVYVCFDLAFEYLRDLDIDSSIAINDFLLQRGALDCFVGQRYCE